MLQSSLLQPLVRADRDPKAPQRVQPIIFAFYSPSYMWDETIRLSPQHADSI